MDEKDLRSIIEQVLTEMNVSGAKPAEKAAAACACESAPEVEDGCIPDITEIDIRKQYLVKNPENGEEYAELKMNAPCRLGIGKAGARYNTLPQLEFRAAHSAAQDAVFNDVDAEFVEKMGLWTVQTQCDSKDTYLTRPDLGRKLSPEAVEPSRPSARRTPPFRSTWRTACPPPPWLPTSAICCPPSCRAWRATRSTWAPPSS